MYACALCTGGVCLCRNITGIDTALGEAPPHTVPLSLIQQPTVPITSIVLTTQYTNEPC